jgi:zinc protease
VLGTAADLQRNGVLDLELERAKQAALSAIEESARSNEYWLTSVLAEAQEQPQRLDWARQRSDDVGAITAADLDDLAERYLDPSRASRFVVMPQQAGP